MPVFLATQEEEIKSITFLGQPRLKDHKTSSQQLAGHGGTCLSSQLYGEANLGNK
jgi:cystathionine beta-lyase/cystathionine gamma-synthase